MKKISLVILASVLAFNVALSVFNGSQVAAAQQVTTVKKAGQYTFKLTATGGMDKYLASQATAKVTGKKANLNIELTDSKLISMINAFTVVGATTNTKTQKGFKITIPAKRLNQTLATTTSVVTPYYSNDYHANVTLTITKFVADKQVSTKKKATKSKTKQVIKKASLKKGTKHTTKKGTKKVTKVSKKA